MNGISFLLVFIGGGLGSLFRYTIGLVLKPISPQLPFATLIANAIGCFFLRKVALCYIFATIHLSRAYLSSDWAQQHPNTQCIDILAFHSHAQQLRPWNSVLPPRTWPSYWIYRCTKGQRPRTVLVPALP